jgi:hypothetical protein
MKFPTEWKNKKSSKPPTRKPLVPRVFSQICQKKEAAAAACANVTGAGRDTAWR